MEFFQEFVEQFRVLLPKNTSASKDDILELLEKKMHLDPTTYQIGKTKVFHLEARYFKRVIFFDL